MLHLKDSSKYKSFSKKLDFGDKKAQISNLFIKKTFKRARSSAWQSTCFVFSNKHEGEAFNQGVAGSNPVGPINM